MKIYLKDLIRLCDGKLIQGNEDEVLENFSKDTRTMQKNDIYVGIKGESIEGSIYYEEALNKGAKGCILNDCIDLNKEVLAKYADKFIVLVKDTVKCLQTLAAYKRDLYDIPVIGITGSVGKTSTKDMVASILSEEYHVLKTEGNYNNEIGLPLTILALKDENCLVLEMGMDALGDISTLSKIAKPTMGIITNVGTSHIGTLKTRENILKAKLEILDGMTNKTLIINNDNDLLHQYYLENKDKINFITYGMENESLYMPYDITNNEFNSTYSLNINNEVYHINLNAPGAHFVLNSLGAIAVGMALGLKKEAIINGLNKLSLTKKRMEIFNKKGIILINDAYNASLDSMKAGLNYLHNLKNSRKVALLGDMLELGDYSEELHRQVGKCVYDNAIDLLLLVGNEAKYIKVEALKLGFNKENIYEFKNNEEALNNLLTMLKENDALFIKASNGMKFYEIFNSLKEKL